MSADRSDLANWIVAQGRLHPGLHTALATALGPRDELVEELDARLAEDADLPVRFMTAGDAS
jgi:hypothetical protein